MDNIAVIGDVHGNASRFEKALDNLDGYVVSLGDITDYGHENFACVRLMWELWHNGQGEMIRGNHDEKLYRYLKQRAEGNVRVQVKGGLLTTVSEIEQMTTEEFEEFHNKFMELYENSNFFKVIGNTILSHAAVHPTWWETEHLSKRKASLALYGQVDSDKPFRHDGFPNRIYDWIDNLNEGETAIVGHDIRSKEAPVFHRSRNGGLAVFTDTGCGKDGVLTAVDLNTLEWESY